MGRFVLTNGKMFAGINGKSQVIIVEDIREAHIFTKEEKCQNILKHNFKDETGWKYIKVEDGKTLNIDMDNSEKIVVDTHREIPKTEIDVFFNQIAELTNTLDMKYLRLKADLDYTEKEILDIYHAMEFYDLSASRGFKIYKMMQDRLRKRREIKDEICKIEMILGSKLEKESIRKVENKLNNISDRNYIPRVLQELFN